MAKMRKRTGQVYATRTAPHGVVEFYADRQGKFRWRVVHRNGRVLTHSSEAYETEQKVAVGFGATRLVLSEAK